MSKQRRKKSSRHPEIKARRKKSSDAVNFLALVFGMATTLVVGSMVYAGFRPGPETPDVENLVVGSDESTYGVSDYEKVLEAGDQDDLVAFLKLLNEWPREATLPTKMRYQSRRIAIADKLLGMEGLEEDLQHFAIESKIEAASSFYGLDYKNDTNLPQAPTQLLNASEPFVGAESELLRRSAKLGMAKLCVYEYGKESSEERLEAAKNAIFSVVNDFKDDRMVIGSIRLLIKVLIRNNVEDGRDLIKEFHQEFGDSESVATRNFSQELNDILLLRDSGYESLIANRFANGAIGRQDLVEASIELTKNPDAGKTLVNRLDVTQGWFEQVNDLDKATRICNAFIENAPSFANPEVGELAKSYGEHGLQRISMLGKEFRFEGRAYDGKLNVSDFENRIVVVFFFEKNNGSMQIAKRLMSLKGELVNKGLEILAVYIGENDREYVSQMVERTPRWKYVDSNDGVTTIPILKQYPVDNGPHLMLVDHKGVVDRLHVQVVDLETHIEQLIHRRSGEGL